MYDYLKEAVKQVPNKVVIQYKDRDMTYSELDGIVKELATSIDLESNDRCNIGIVCNNPIFFTVSLLAISYLGCVTVPIYAHTGKERINELIHSFSLKYLIVEKGYDVMENSDLDKSPFPLLDLVICYNKNVSKNNTLEKCELILLSSGTTGVPKGIMLSKDNIKSNVKAIGNYLNLTPDDKVFMVKNMNHSSSIIGELLVSLDNQCSILFNSKILTASSMINSICSNDITVFFAVPTILREIILKRNELQLDNLDKLKIINFYGAPMSVEDINLLIDLLPNCNLIYSYGLTEASPRVTYIKKDDLIKKPESSGKPIENVKVRIKNNKVNEIDEIIVSGPNVMLGYYNDCDRTTKTIIEGELYTGDYGYIDEDGYLYVRGRKDNMIISAGKNIYPEEIEQVLQTVNGIKEVLVRGVSDDKGVEKLTAYVSFNDNIERDKKVLFDVCRNRLENYKIPNQFIYVDTLEKTPSGKIVRNQKL